MENKLVSIIIPVFNTAAYLQKCLDSVVEQSYKNLDIIIVNDGSTDESGKICDQYLIKDNRIRLIHQCNKGLAEVRNIGLNMSRGEYILFVDSDDYISSFLVEKVMKKIEVDKIDIAFYSCYLISDGGYYITNPYYNFDFSNYTNKIYTNTEIINLLFNQKLHTYCWFFIANKKLYKDINFPQNRRYEDMGTIYKVFGNINNASFLNEKLYYYVQHLNSITHNLKKSDVNYILLNIKEMEQYIKDKFPYIKNEFNFYASCILLSSYIKGIKGNCDDKILNEIEDLIKEKMKFVSIIKFIKNPYLIKAVLFKLHILKPTCKILFKIKNINT